MRLDGAGMAGHSVYVGGIRSLRHAPHDPLHPHIHQATLPHWQVHLTTACCPCDALLGFDCCHYTICSPRRLLPKNQVPKCCLPNLNEPYAEATHSCSHS